MLFSVPGYLLGLEVGLVHVSLNAPMSVRDEQCQNNLAYIFNSTDTQRVELLRMRRAPFYQLCDLFRSRELLKGTIHCTIEEQVAMFLHVVGHNQRFSCIKFSFRRSTETISSHFQEVLYVVGELRNELIVVAEPPKLSRLKCAGHRHKGNTSSNALQTE